MKNFVIALILSALSAVAEDNVFVQQYCARAEPLHSKREVLKYALDRVSLEGLYLELGVWRGDSINFIASTTSLTVYGFDSFEGLPETWDRERAIDFSKGTFGIHSTEEFPVVASNVVLIQGLFEDTLPLFSQARIEKNKIAFMHVDCDLYSSTRSAFKYLGPLIQEGTIIVFDELYGYQGYEKHELKAFNEFLTQYAMSAEFLAYTVLGEQAAVRIVKTRARNR